MTQSVDFIERQINKLGVDIENTQDILDIIKTEYSEADSFRQQQSLETQLTTLKSKRQKLLQHGIDVLREELKHDA